MPARRLKENGFGDEAQVYCSEAWSRLLHVKSDDSYDSRFDCLQILLSEVNRDVPSTQDTVTSEHACSVSNVGAGTMHTQQVSHFEGVSGHDELFIIASFSIHV